MVQAVSTGPPALGATYQGVAEPLGNLAPWEEMNFTFV